MSGTIWALGYATKRGLAALSDKKQKIVIKSTPVGNMFAPDPDDFAGKFLSVLGPEDTVITPSGPNGSYPAACLQKTADIWWISPGTLAKEANGGRPDIPSLLLRLFKEKQGIFYPYLPADAGVAELRIMMQDWLALERQVVRDGNAHAQHLRREREYFRYFPEKKEAWIARFTKQLWTLFVHQMRKFKVKLGSVEQKKAEESAATVSRNLYQNFVAGTEKEAGRARQQLIAARMEAFGVEVLLDATEKEVEKLLAALPQNKLFDGLISPGSTKVRAEVLAFIRNPLLYANVWALHSYAGIGRIKDGQAVRSRRGESDASNRVFKKALIFDFGEKYWANDPVGFFSQLYYAYKGFQYYVYWDLICLTEEVFRLLGKKAETSDPYAEEEQEEEVDVGRLAGKSSTLGSLVQRLKAIADDRSLPFYPNGLPIIADNVGIRGAIERLVVEPDTELLWEVFSRKHFNLQVPRSRIEQRTKRFIGRVLVDSVYYRWLEDMGAPLPLANDRIYQNQYAAVTGEPFTTVYDHQIVLQYYRLRLAECRAIRGPLPMGVGFKLCIPDNREEFLTPLANADLNLVWQSLSKDEKKKYLPIFPPRFQLVEVGEKQASSEDVEAAEII